jgi:hypothetical protein
MASSSSKSTSHAGGYKAGPQYVHPSLQKSAPSSTSGSRPPAKGPSGGSMSKAAPKKGKG